MRYKLQTLLVITACSAVLALWARSVFTGPFRGSAPASLLSPIQTQVTVHPNGSVQTRRITYSLANYGVSEFGKIRLAVQDKPFSGKSSGTLILSVGPKLANAISNSVTGAPASHTGVGNRRFETKIIAGGSSCRFGGLSFQIVDCELHLLDETFPVDGAPTLIVVNAKGQIKAVLEIPVRDGAVAGPGIGADRADPDASGDLGNGREGKAGDADDPFGDSPFD